MKERLLAWISCPACGGALRLTGAVGNAVEVERGELTCARCAARYPIVRGIPRLLPGPLSAESAETANRFGYAWTRFAEIRPEYRAQFLGWIAPLGREAFVGRRVFDAGCGKGRHLRLAVQFGASEVIGIDLGPAVEAAAQNTADLDNVHVVQGDLTRPPLRAACMDLVFSIGVLHHLPEPAAGVRALARLLAHDGLLVSWVYAREGNRRFLVVVDPLRRLTSRLPLRLVWAFAGLLTVPLWAVVRGVYGPFGAPRAARRLPYGSYLADLAVFPFREIHSIAFDHLLAPIAHYLTRSEVERLYAGAPLTLRSLRWHHENSWAAYATRRDAGD